MRDAAGNKQSWKWRRTPTQDPSTDLVLLLSLAGPEDRRRAEQGALMTRPPLLASSGYPGYRLWIIQPKPRQILAPCKTVDVNKWCPHR